MCVHAFRAPFFWALGASEVRGGLSPSGALCIVARCIGHQHVHVHVYICARIVAGHGGDGVASRQKVRARAHAYGMGTGLPSLGEHSSAAAAATGAGLWARGDAHSPNPDWVGVLGESHSEKRIRYAYVAASGPTDGTCKICGH